MKNQIKILFNLIKSIVKYFGKKQKEVIVQNIETPQIEEYKPRLPRFKRNNNRKNTKGRRTQVIKLSNGRNKYIKHSY